MPGASRNGAGAPGRERALRAQGRETRRRLLDAATVVFDRRGYHAARVDDIVEVASTSHGTFYLYFSNKDDLLRALLADLATALDELSDALPDVGPSADGHAALRTWLGRLLDLCTEHAAVIRAWSDAEAGDRSIGAIGAGVLGRFTAEITRRLADVARPAGVRADIAALALVSTVERFHHHVRWRGLDVDRVALLDALSAILFLGVFGGSPAALDGAPRGARA